MTRLLPECQQSRLAVGKINSDTTAGAPELVRTTAAKLVFSATVTAARIVSESTDAPAAFQGLAQSAAQMSKYYEDQLEKIVPAVKVDAGVDVYFIVLGFFYKPATLGMWPKNLLLP